MYTEQAKMDCIMYTEQAKMEAVSRDTSHVSTVSMYTTSLTLDMYSKSAIKGKSLM